jgi:hypothetical protein
VSALATAAAEEIVAGGIQGQPPIFQRESGASPPIRQDGGSGDSLLNSLSAMDGR